MSASIRHWRSLGWLLLWSGLAAAQAPTPPPGRGQLIDQVVAVVRPPRASGLALGPAETVITLNDLKFEAAVVFIQRGRPEAAFSTLDEEALTSALEYAISQRLHAQEAEKLQVFTVQPAELDAALQELQGQLGSVQALDRFLVRQDRTRAELRRVLERSLRAARTLDSRIRLRAQVSEAEVRRYYERTVQQTQGELSGVKPGTYEEVRASLREKLFRERYTALARAETAQLREQADVRLLVSLASLAGEGA